MREAAAVAMRKGIRLPDDIVTKSVEKIFTFPPGTKSSMQLDFEQGKPTELETFIGYIVKTGESLGIELPCHREVYRKLLAVTSPFESPRGREPSRQAPPP
jgi:2-dehydropantoate 2-reductase